MAGCSMIVLTMNILSASCQRFPTGLAARAFAQDILNSFA